MTHFHLLDNLQPTGPAIFPSSMPARAIHTEDLPVLRLLSDRIQPMTDFSLEGQCHSWTCSSTQLRSLHSQRVSRHWPGNATVGLTALAQCPGHCHAHVRGLSSPFEPAQLWYWDPCAPPQVPRGFSAWLQGIVLVYSQGSIFAH